MSMIPVMAFKNLFRYRKRTMITAGAIGFGLMVFIVSRSLLVGINRDTETNLELYETASGRITAPGYWKKRETLPLSMSFDPSVVDPILEKAGAEHAPRINFGGDLIFYKDPFPEDGSIPGLFTAIDPQADENVFALRDSLVEGSWLEPDEPGLLLGYWLAEDIGAKVGSYVLVETRTRDGYTQVIDLQIVGILNCPNPTVTRAGMFLPLSIADDYLEMGGEVTEVNVSFGRGGGAEASFADLGPEIAGVNLEALDISTLAADFLAVSQTKTASNGMIIFLLLIIATVGISNTMMMAVYERVRELGMMRAMGMLKSQVRVLFLWESAGIGLLGGAIGVVLGVLSTWPLVKWGLDYSALLRDNNVGYRIQGQMFAAWDVPGIVTAFFTGVGMAVFVALFCTRRILRLNIPASLRFE